MALQKFNAVAGFSVNEFTYDINGNVLTQPIGVIDANANVYANSLFVERYANLGSISNVVITGGSANYILITDGAGNLSWSSAAGIETATGSNREVQFNDGGIFGASSAFTFNKASNTLTITGNLTTNNADLGNLATANYYSGDGYLLSNITPANINGQVSNANLAWQVYNNEQPNITSVGTLSNLYISGTGSVSGANLVSANYITGTLTTQAQPNITSVGTLTIANVSGNINSGNASLGNTASANYFVGNGSLLTGVIGNANYAAYAGNVTLPSQPNITSVGTLSSLTVSGLITATATGIKVANIQDSTGTITIQTRYNTNPGDVGITSNLTVGSGGTGNLTVNGISDLGPIGNVKISGGSANYVLITDGASGLSWSSQIPNALVAGTVYNNAQPNITSVGTLSNLSVSNNVIVGGNLTVDGTFVYTNVDVLVVEDPIIEQGGGPNGDPLTSNNGMDRGALLHYYTTAPVDAFMGWDVSNSEFGLGSNVTVTNNVVTWNEYGNLRIRNLLLSGDVIAGNLVSANYFTGTLTTAAQPNITSTGTLNGVTVTGTANLINASNVSLGPVSNVHITGGSANYILQTDGSGALSWVNPGAVTVAGSNTQVQYNNNGVFGSNANFTFNQTTKTLTVDNITSLSGNITGANLVSANYFTGTTGTLTDLTTTGNVLIGGNLTVNGSTEYTNVTNLYVQDPIIEMGGNANGGPLTSNDGKDRGTLLHYYTTAPVDAFMGWDNSNGEFALGSNVSVSSEVVTFNTFGNLRVGNISGAGATLTGNLQVTGNITRDSKNIPTYSSATTAPSNPRIGDQWYDQVNDITYQYIYDGVNYFWVDISSGYVGANTSAVANTLTLRDSNANIYANYFIGSGLTITGISTLGPNSNVKITGGTSGQYLQTDGAGNLTWTTITATGSYISNGTSNVNAGTVNGNITVSIAGTSNTVVFTSTGVNVAGYINTGTGNITSGNAALGNLATANYFSGNGSLLTGLNASNLASGTIPSAILGNSTLYVGTTSIALNRGSASQSLTGITSIDGYANTVSYATQSNITSVGTLNSVTATGTVNFTGASNVSLGPVGNIHISGGSSGYVLKTDGAGTLSWAADSTNPAGSNTQVQFNDGGSSLGASAGFTFDKTANTLTVNGNITTNNANLGNLVTANYHSGNGFYLSGIYGGNVIGQVGNSLVAGTVYSNAQPNITSTGTLNGVTVTGTANLIGASNVSLGPVGNIHISGGTANYVLQTDGSGTLSWVSPSSFSTSASGSNTQIQFNDNGSFGASAAFSFNKGTNAVSITGNITSGNASLGNLVTANYFSGNGSLLTAITGANVTGTVSSATSATTAVTVTANAQPNITSTGTLNGVTATGTVDLTSASNVSLGPVGNIHISGGTANYVLTTDGSGTLSWNAPASSPPLTMVVDTFTADGSGNTYTLSTTPPSKDFLLVNIDGVSQLGASYSLTANVVTLGGTPVFGAEVEIKTLGGNTGQAQSGISTGKAIAMAIVFGF